MATQTKLTPEQVEIERLRAQVRLLEEQNRSVQEGKDQTGTYGWTNIPNEDADRMRSLKQGKRFISQEERNRAAEEWSARGGDQGPSPESNVIERDAATGKVISAPDGAVAKDAAPVQPRATEDGGVESVDII